MEPFSPFLNLNGIRVQSKKEGSLVVDNLGVYGCAVVEAKDLLSEYFGKIIPIRGSSSTEQFLQKEDKIALKGGVILKTHGIIIRREA